MCNCHCHGGKGGCGIKKTAFILILIGALNWGFVGVGMLMNMGSGLNLVHLAIGSWSMTVEAVVYVLVGLAALIKIFGCPCKKCKEGCKECQVSMDKGAKDMNTGMNDAGATGMKM
jgi:uncharacterized membrane protein YuzA (DUF378 family)